VAATNQVKDQTAASDTPVVGTSDAKRSPLRGDQTQRVRELIYFFRTYRVFCRDEEWAETIRELATIGKAAVPELVAELDRTDRDATLRSLAFTLRAIGDPRAVPALIRAIPKALRRPGSDCGMFIADPDLRAFMKANQNYKDDNSDSVLCGRPVNEIVSAIERITRHREPPGVGDNDPLRHVFLGGTPAQQAQQRAMYLERQKRWEAWWSEHSREFATQDQLQSAELPKRDKDLVELAGLARFGPLFPTGPGVRLGPIRMLRLTTSLYLNGKSHLDLDTGRVFAYLEGTKNAAPGQPADFESRINSWYRRNGIDVRCQGAVDGMDLQLWLIDDNRWDSLEAEIQKNGPLELGREATHYMTRFDKTWTDFKYDELATFLFTTREGGRGIVQVFPKDPDADRVRVRYRMWSAAPANPGARPPAAEPRTTQPPGTPFRETVMVTLDPPAERRECLLSLKTGRKSVPPEFIKADALAEPSSLARNQRFIEWCRNHGIDVFAEATTPDPRVAAAPAPLTKAAAAFEKAAVPVTHFALIGLEMRAAPIVSQTFDEMSVEDAREILARMSETKFRTAFMHIDDQLVERPSTFVFTTREGAVGLLQLEVADIQAGKLGVRYRLEK
jgi:hypothetical protein